MELNTSLTAHYLLQSQLMRWNEMHSIENMKGMIEHALEEILQQHGEKRMGALMIAAMGILKSRLVNFPKVKEVSPLLDEVAYKRFVVQSCLAVDA